MEAFAGNQGREDTQASHGQGTGRRTERADTNRAALAEGVAPWRTYRSPNGESWARVSGNRMVLKELLFGEPAYLAIEGGRVVSVADSAERAMGVWG